jgi:hypothetical protein
MPRGKREIHGLLRQVQQDHERLVGRGLRPRRPRRIGGWRTDGINRRLPVELIFATGAGFIGGNLATSYLLDIAKKMFEHGPRVLGQ